MSESWIVVKPGGARPLGILAFLVILALLGYGAAHQMDTTGHWITGMSNRVVWGMPHVFAIFLIVSASGALNVASLGSVFDRSDYKPWARLSGALAISLLAGGLLVLVLDLGRPERLIVAMTHYNFKSVFAWNIFLYSGFFLVVVCYLFTLFERQAGRYMRLAGTLAFSWRFILTAGTGSIFGFLVARPLYDAAMMIPLFIVLSLVLGTAIFMLVSDLLCAWARQSPDEGVQRGLGHMLGWFMILQLFLTAAFHITNLYAAEHAGVERFILVAGGHYTALFWFGQVLIGGLVPVALLLAPSARENRGLRRAASLLAVAGGYVQLYVIIIAGQAYPQILFPGKTVSSSFFDGQIAGYTPSLFELALGIGGVSVSLLILVLLARILPFVPRKTVVTGG